IPYFTPSRTPEPPPHNAFGVFHQPVRHGNSISLAYIAKSNLPTGTGVYYLMEHGSYYAGYWMGVDFPLGHKVQCPYLLTSLEKPETESCEHRWPETFNGQPCVILKHR
ncbi:hypothetical protein ACW73L_21775, partial [Methylolobus aquaticus]